MNSDKESSPIFKLFTPQTAASKENGNINKATEKTTATQTSQLSNNDFDDCSQLPDGLKKCVSAGLIGKPLDDPFYDNKETFIVVNNKGQLFRFSSTNALGIFAPTSAIRSNAIRLLTHPFYAIFMVIVILAFCLTNVFDGDTILHLRLFLIIFLLEFILKIVSHGFILSPYSYLRNGFNILDVVLNILLLCGSWYLAELRILKIISYSLNLRRTIRLYYSSCKLLKDFIIYMTLMVAILSTLLLQFYMGMLTQGCCTQNGDAVKFNDSYILCGNSSGSKACPDSYSCLQGTIDNPDFGFTSFDDIFASFLSTFRLITRDYWENLLQLVLSAAGPWHIITFIVIIFIISYQVLSLIWGQIAVSYNYIRLERWEQKLIAEDVGVGDTASQQSNNDQPTGFWSKVQRFFFFIIYNPFVVLFVIICIILNTLCMALDHHDMTIDLEKFLRSANYFFVIVFVIEAILKLLALGVIRYFKDEWNTFDFIVTFLGLIELFLEGVQGLSVFRSFRLLRPLRLGKVVPAFDLILTRMKHLFSVVSGQTIIFLMGIYIFTVFGYRNFHYGETVVAGDKELWRFTDLMHSFMVVFRAQCGEWIETMFLTLNKTTKHTQIFIFYFILVTVGSFQIMHIFTALLCTNDDSTAISTKKSQKLFEKTTKPKEKFQLQPFLKEKLLEPSVKKIYDEYKPRRDIESVGADTSEKMVTKAPIVSKIVDDPDTSIPIESSPTNDQGVGSKRSENKYFQYCVALCIIVSSFALAMGYGVEIHIHPKMMNGFVYVHFLFIGLLSIDVVTKLVARGWKLCVTDIWYWLDLFNVIIAVLEIFIESEEISVLASLRILSLVSRWHGLHVITNAILKQMWFLVNTLLVCLAFWLIFAIMGVQLFAGKFYSCVDEDNVKVETVDDRQQCNDTRHDWENAFMHFDDVFDSYYSLLEVSSFKGWIQIINNAVDSRGVHDQPMDEANLYMFFYFVIFIVCGVFVCTNVIVGMLVQHMIHFGSLTELLERSKSKSENSNETPDEDDAADQNPSDSKFVNFVRSRAFEMVAFGSYMFYIIVLMCEHNNMVKDMGDALDYVHHVLIVLLIIEIAIRAYGYRKKYFANSWNRFDVALVIFTIMDVILLEVAKYFVSSSLLRILRIGRFNGLIASFSKSLARCGKVISRTWNTVSMLYVLLFLVICVYSSIGMVLYQDDKIEFGNIDVLNFKTFGQSVILMIQMSTAAGWDGLLAQLSPEHATSAPLFLLSFLYIASTILLNVMLVIGLEFYKELTSVEDEQQQLKSDDLNDFNEKWRAFAQDDLKYVPKNRLNDFFKSLNETSALRPAEFDAKEFDFLGVDSNEKANYSRSTLLIALNRMRLNKQ